MLASLPGYFYSTGKEGLWVPLYHNSTLNWKLDNGTGIVAEQKTDYPWDGAISIEMKPERPSAFSLFLRLPAWSSYARVSVNGQGLSSHYGPASYCEISRTWRAGDQVRIILSMEPQAVFANPRVDNTRGSAALQRGPLVYCLESVDNPGVNIFDTVLPLDPRHLSDGIAAKYRETQLDGIVVLEKQALVYTPPLEDEMLYNDEPYMDYHHMAALTFIPYYAWANRGASFMRVWMPYMYTDRKFYERGY
jgi:hypothetical protein